MDSLTGAAKEVTETSFILKACRDDAKPYQEKDVKLVLSKVAR